MALVEIEFPPDLLNDIAVFLGAKFGRLAVDVFPAGLAPDSQK